jgi:hypothetical protein
MGKFRRKVIGVFKKVMGVNSSRSCGSSSTHHTALEKSPMHEEEETVPTKDEEEQEQEMEEGDDDPHLDLVGAQEMKAYNLVKDREFIHTPAFDPDLLRKIGIDIEFTTIWKVVGWENFAPIDEQGSRLLAIQFLCSLQEVEGGISFCLFEKKYFLTWKNLSSHLGFSTKWSIDLNHALKGFNCHEFWRVISDQNVVGKF